MSIAQSFKKTSADATHKDSNPITTITRIKKSLSTVGIHLIEKNWVKFNNHCYSVMIGDPQISGISSNGKGCRADLARASAYAEFMERIQNGMLYPKKYGIMPEKISYSHDAIKVGLKKLRNKYPKIFRSILKGENKKSKPQTKYTSKRELTCVPYFNLKDKDVHYLPHELILSASGSNGMCAGNTLYEALVQGLCEIFERHAIKQFFFNRQMEFPIIPTHELLQHDSLGLTRSFISQGFNLVGLDFSLDGKFPVIAVLLIDRDKNLYKLGVGSDPIFEVAIQRCLTEVVQGLNPKGIRARMQDMRFEEWPSELDSRFILMNYYRLILDGNGSINFEKILTSTKVSKHKSIFKFTSTNINNKELLKTLVTGILNEGHDIYVRDVSFLEFPSYQIYIPGISEKVPQPVWQNLIYGGIQSFFTEAPLQINYLSKKELVAYATYFENLCNTDYVRCAFDSISEFMNVKFPETSAYHELHYDIFLSMLFYRIGNMQKAYVYLHRFLAENGPIENECYYRCALYYLKGRSIGTKPSRLKSLLNTFFSNQVAEEVINDFSTPKNIFKYYPFPKSKKELVKHLEGNPYYIHWKSISKKINRKIKTTGIKQENLKAILGDIL